MSRSPTQDDLAAAVAAGIITPAQAEALTGFLARRSGGGQRPSGPAGSTANEAERRFDLTHVLWYAGALIIITAMGLFSTLAFSAMGAAGLATTALISGFGFLAVGNYLWFRKGLTTPGGLLVAVAVSMAPLFCFAVQEHFGLWGKFGDPGAYRGFYQWIKGSFLPMELATLVAGGLALRVYRFPFIVMLMAVALWFMSMDLAPWFMAEGKSLDWETRRHVSVWFGLLMVLGAWFVDLKQKREDFAFWLHVFGIMTLWGGITASASSSEMAKFVYCLMNLGLIGFSVFLNRRVYAVFGTIGVMIYLGHLSSQVFKDSLMFPFALSLLGLAVIGLGLLYNKHRARLSAWMDEALPPAVALLRPAHARATAQRG